MLFKKPLKWAVKLNLHYLVIPKIETITIKESSRKKALQAVKKIKRASKADLVTISDLYEI